MKKILLIDPLSPKGHKDINQIALKLLENKFTITYVSSENFINKSAINNIEHIEIEEKFFKNGSGLTNRIRYLKVLSKISRIIDKNYFDSIIFLSYETISFSLYTHLNKMKVNNKWGSVYLLNHLNIDEIKKSRIKKMFFYLIPKKITHLCYEDFITERVLEDFKRKAITIRHNLNFYKIIENEGIEVNSSLKNWFDNEDLKLVALSNNKVDHDLIELLIELDRKHYFKERNIRLLIKNRDLEYEGSQIKLTTKFLSEADYSYSMLKSDYVFLPYQAAKYDLRISGVFFDSITFNKPVICANTRFFEFIFKKFGAVGYKYSRKEELLAVLNNLENKVPESFQNVVNMIKEYYSDDNVRSDFENLLDS